MRSHTDIRADERSTIPEKEEDLIEGEEGPFPHTQNLDPVERGHSARMPDY